MTAMTKICPMCERELPMDAFYRRRGNGVNVYCKRCAIDQTVTRQRQLKAQAIAYKGGRCQTCGYSRCDSALEFHHRDPSQKDFSLGHVGTTTFEKIKAELEKCDLLCANCHREAHAGHKRARPAPNLVNSGHETKRCPKCQQVLPVTAFSSRRNTPWACSYCKACSYEHAVERQRRLKQQAIDYKGSRCSQCGYDRYAGSLEFHHRDPASKDYTFSQVKMKNLAKVTSELDKCDLLCVNCHREAHARQRGLL